MILGIRPFPGGSSREFRDLGLYRSTGTEEGEYEEQDVRLADFHDGSLSRGQKLS